MFTETPFARGRFFHGDCFDVMASLPSGSVDMVLCDLPYGTTDCAWDSILPLDRLWQEYLRVGHPETRYVLTASQPFSSVLVASQIEMFKHEWVWIKNRASNPYNAKYAPMRAHEQVLVFYKKFSTYNPQKTAGKPYKGFASKTGATTGDAFGNRKSYHAENATGDRYPLDHISFDIERGLHPTQKPVALFEYLIRTYSQPGQFVLDNTAGSGTTALAAENAGRRWICIERDAEYAAKAVVRIREHVVGVLEEIDEFDALLG